MRPTRNDPCPCGSGKKYKRCCGDGTALASKPAGTLVSLLRQGESLLRVGDWTGAMHFYGGVLGLDPDHAEALHYLGLALLQSGSLPEALPLMARSLTLKPADPEFLNNYGYACEQAGLLEDAVRNYTEAARVRPRYGDAWFNLGNVLLRMGRQAEAEEAFAHAVSLNPRDIGYWNNLGNARLFQKKYAEAEAAYRTALGLDADHVEAWNNLGSALRGQERHEESAAAFRRALELRPNFTEAWSNLGNAYFAMAQLQPAVEAYEQAIALNPSNPVPPLEGLGLALLDLGDPRRANAYFSRLIEVSPLFGSAYYGWARSKRIEEADRSMAKQIEHIIEEGRVEEESLPSLYFALGVIYDGLVEPGAAFRHYREGNALMKRSYEEDPFDPEAHERRISEVVEIFADPFFVVRQGWGNPSMRPIFIVGMPRSGTTLTEQILSSHPLVSGGGERAFWGKQEKVMSTKRPTDWARDEVAAAAEACLADMDSVSMEALHVTDKMPGNFLRLGLIHLAFPNARIIHCRRNPVDTCLSIYFQMFQGLHTYAYDLDDLASFYRQYRRMMEHWREVLPADVFLEVDYEALVEDQEGESRRLIEFCGLEWDDRCLEFHKTERVVKTASNWQVRQPIYKTSKERWRKYEPWIGPLLDLLREAEST